VNLYVLFYRPAYIFHNLEIALPSGRQAAGLLKRGNMDALNILLAVAALLVPIGLAWLYINRK